MSRNFERGNDGDKNQIVRPAATRHSIRGPFSEGPRVPRPQAPLISSYNYPKSSSPQSLQRGLPPSSYDRVSRQYRSFNQTHVQEGYRSSPGSSGRAIPTHSDTPSSPQGPPLLQGTRSVRGGRYYAPSSSTIGKLPKPYGQSSVNDGYTDFNLAKSLSSSGSRSPSSWHPSSPQGLRDGDIRQPHHDHYIRRSPPHDSGAPHPRYHRHSEDWREHIRNPHGRHPGYDDVHYSKRITRSSPHEEYPRHFIPYEDHRGVPIQQHSALACRESGQFRLEAPYTVKVRHAESKQAGETYHKVVSRDEVSPVNSNKTEESESAVMKVNSVDSSQAKDDNNIGCTCKKSKCLKLYCQCFAAGIMCAGNCRCLACMNTPIHEQERQDAIKSILARNPAAFDTKFKATTSNSDCDLPKVTHKLGCKCRKSACLKKYCECYHANVKCSANCRCIGCQNMPPGGFGQPPNEKAILSTTSGDVVQKKVRPLPPRNGGETWMMDAAQNLAYLKNASPSRPTEVSTPGHEITPVPSLTASETASKDDDYSDNPRGCTEERERLSPVTSSVERKSNSAVNTLLMAAYAMTELQGVGSTSSSLPTLQRGINRRLIENVDDYRSLKRKSPSGTGGEFYAEAIPRHESNEGSSPIDPSIKRSRGLVSISEEYSTERPVTNESERRPVGLSHNLYHMKEIS